MKAPRRLLEAERKTLYEQIPVPPEWHREYTEGKATTKEFKAIGPKQLKTVDA